MSERRSVTREELAAGLWRLMKEQGIRIHMAAGDLPPNAVVDAIFDALPADPPASGDVEAARQKVLAIVGEEVCREFSSCARRAGSLNQIEHDGEVINRLTAALRVASHSPHDQDGEPNEGFPVCSVCGAIQTTPASGDVEAAWRALARDVRLGLIGVHGTGAAIADHRPAIEAAIRAEGLDVEPARAMWYAHTEDERFAGPISADPYGDFEEWLLARLAEAADK